MMPPKWTVLGQIGPSFAPKLTVLSQSVKENGPKSVDTLKVDCSKACKCESGRSQFETPKSVELDGQKV